MTTPSHESAILPQPAEKRTRAQVLREKVKVRLATDETGPEIAAILQGHNIVFPGTDWSKVFPSWLIATVEDEVVGCILVLPGKPFGFLEFLFTRKTAPYKVRVLAFQKLIEQGAATLKLAGCSYALGTVEPGNKAFLDILKKYYALHVGSAELLARRLKT